VIGRLSGVVVEQAGDGSCVLDVSGVGYEVFVPLRLLGHLPVAGPTTLHVHTHVREDALMLYGFSNLDDREAFRTLLSVSGVGPKLAMTVLSDLSAPELAVVVARADRGRLEAISGVGKKTAARLLLELKDKLPIAALSAIVVPPVNNRSPQLQDANAQVADALTRLGFTRAQAEAAVTKAALADAAAPVEQLLRQALSTLG
jgi:Holliday junction DNA helicase RuvA